MPQRAHTPKRRSYVAVFPILADPVDVKKGDQLCESGSQPSIQPDKVDPPVGSWPRPGLDFDHIGQNWEDSSIILRFSL